MPLVSGVWQCTLVSITNVITQLQTLSLNYKRYHSITNVITQLQTLSLNYKRYQSAPNIILQQDTSTSSLLLYLDRNAKIDMLSSLDLFFTNIWSFIRKQA